MVWLYDHFTSISVLMKFLHTVWLGTLFQFGHNPVQSVIMPGYQKLQVLHLATMLHQALSQMGRTAERPVSWGCSSVVPVPRLWCLLCSGKPVYAPQISPISYPCMSAVWAVHSNLRDVCKTFCIPFTSVLASHLWPVLSLDLLWILQMLVDVQCMALHFVWVWICLSST